MMFKYCLFDLDGTLVDTLPGIEYSIREAIREVLPETPIPSLHSFIGPPIKDIIKSLFPQQPEKTIQAIEHTFRLIYDTVGWKNTQEYPGVAPTLTQLNNAGIACFVVTNKPLLPTQLILSHLGLSVFFDAIITPDTCQPRFDSKTKMTEYTLRSFKINPLQACFIGDSEDDAIAASSCHIPFFAAGYGYGDATRQQEARTILFQFQDLLNHF